VTGSGADACVVCPWHGSVFRLIDGAVVHGPATSDQPVLRVRVRAGMVEVCQPPGRNRGTPPSTRDRGGQRFRRPGGFQPRLFVYGEEALLAMDLAAAVEDALRRLAA
jgi:hypothetical protein